MKSGLDVRPLLAAAKKHQRIEKFLQQGSTRAVRRSVTAARTEQARAIKRRYAVRIGVNAVKRIFRIRPRRTGVVMRGSVRRGLLLENFPTRQTPKGVVAQIHKGKRTLYPSAFKMPAGSRFKAGRVFRRKYRGAGTGTSFKRGGMDIGPGDLHGRFPIVAMYGPDIVQMSNSRPVAKAARTAFFKRIDREIPAEERRAFKRAGL